MFEGLKAFYRRHSRRVTVAEKAQSQIEDDKRTLYTLELSIENALATKAMIEKRMKRLGALVQKENDEDENSIR